MGAVSQDYLFEHLTWGDINRLAGIAVPTTDPETTLAEGHLMYQHNGRTISIEVAG